MIKEHRSSEALLRLQVETPQKISRILRQLERMRRRYMDLRLKDWSLQGDMYLFLLLVSREPGCSQDDVVKELMMDKGNAAKMASKLQQLGYLNRESSPQDRRKYALYLTEKGDMAAKAVRTALVSWQNALVGEMTEEETEWLVREMGGMLTRAETVLSSEEEI